MLMQVTIEPQNAYGIRNKRGCGINARAGEAYQRHDHARLVEIDSIGTPLRVEEVQVNIWCDCLLECSNRGFKV